MKLERRKAFSRKPWTDEEQQLLLSELSQGLTSKELYSTFPDRSVLSIRSKVRKLRVKHDLFGASYRDKKESFTVCVAKECKPRVVFEGYAGIGLQTFRWIDIADTVFAVERNRSKWEKFYEKAVILGFKLISERKGWYVLRRGVKRVHYFVGDNVRAAATLCANNVKVDLIDLDTCGSTVPTLSTFLIMLRPKHLTITHGEFHSLRFKRDDVLRRLFLHADINNNPLPLTIDKMCIELDNAVKIAALRAHNETVDSFWLELKSQIWLGRKNNGMLRRHYQVCKPLATADCLNLLTHN